MRASLILVVAVGVAAAGSKPGDEGTPEHRKATELVQQLGAPRFAAREEAARRLIEMGDAAVPALVAGVRSADPEVRDRSAALLPQAKAIAWKRRAEAYLDDKDGIQKHDLPLLPEFEKVVGKPDVGSRKLFAEMVKANGALLDETGRDTKAAAAALRARCQTLNSHLQTDGKQHRADLGDLAAVFFVQALVTTPRADWRSAGESVYLLANPGIADGLKAKDVGPALRRILVRWAESRADDDQVAYQCFALAVRESPFPEAVPILTHLAKDSTAEALAVRATAIDALGKVADGKAMAALADLVFDAKELFGNEQYRVGDHALTRLLLAQLKSPSDYGLGNVLSLRLRAGGRRDVVEMQFMAFPDDEARKKGIKKWKDESAKK